MTFLIYANSRQSELYCEKEYFWYQNLLQCIHFTLFPIYFHSLFCTFSSLGFERKDQGEIEIQDDDQLKFLHLWLLVSLIYHYALIKSIFLLMFWTVCHTRFYFLILEIMKQIAMFANSDCDKYLHGWTARR